MYFRLTTRFRVNLATHPHENHRRPAARRHAMPILCEQLAFGSLKQYDLTLKLDWFNDYTPDDTVVLRCNDGRTRTCGELRENMRQRGMTPTWDTLLAAICETSDAE